MISTFAAMAHEEYGHDEFKPVIKEEPATYLSEFSQARHWSCRIHNDGGLSLYSPSGGSHSNLFQLKPVVFSQTMTTVFNSALQVNLARLCEVCQCNRFFLHGIITPSLKSVGPGF